MAISFLGGKNHLEKKMLNWVNLTPVCLVGSRGRRPCRLRAQERESKRPTCRAAPPMFSQEAAWERQH